MHLENMFTPRKCTFSLLCIWRYICVPQGNGIISIVSYHYHARWGYKANIVCSIYHLSHEKSSDFQTYQIHWTI